MHVLRGNLIAVAEVCTGKSAHCWFSEGWRGGRAKLNASCWTCSSSLVCQIWILLLWPGRFVAHLKAFSNSLLLKWVFMKTLLGLFFLTWEHIVQQVASEACVQNTLLRRKTMFCVRLSWSNNLLFRTCVTSLTLLNSGENRATFSLPDSNLISLVLSSFP